MSLQIIKLAKSSLKMLPKRSYSLELPPTYNMKESSIITLGDILSEDLTHDPSKDFSFSLKNPPSFIAKRKDSLPDLSQHEDKGMYRIQVQRASVIDLQNKNQKELDIWSKPNLNQVFLDAEPSLNIGKGPIEHEISNPHESSPFSEAKGGSIKLDTFFHKSPDTCIALDSERNGLSNIDKASSNAHSPSKTSFYFESAKGRSESNVKSHSEEATQLRLSTQITDQNTKKRWLKLGIILQSLALLQRQEVKAITDAESIKNEIEQFSPTRRETESPQRKNIIMKDDLTGEAFDFIRRVQMFCECAAIGSPEHIKRMVKMIEQDPKRFMFEPSDPMHFVNTKNNNGWTPLYIATRNGNLEVVKLLLQNKANQTITCKIYAGSPSEEIPLQSAVKWGYSNIVEYLLKNGEYDKTMLKKCLKTASSKVVRALLRQHLNAGKPKSKISNLCNCWGS